ncbi:MAG TPA: hypothetical protein VNV43_04460 [Candidatus Acidoferrales bacterium]|jgi:hypothetical protein|nr:hypothetical protein [Candidatus Acidoferrales bacterium]
MAAAKKKGNKGAPVDPISERARALNDQISSLEAEIKKLDSQIQRTPSPKLRSTAIPHGNTVTRKPDPAPSPPKPAAAAEPVFEEIKTLKPADEAEPADRFNELGVRKYDLPGLLQKIRDVFKRPTANNPRLVHYLAAGGVHGLRPLRYEKRVARNRFWVLTIFLLLILFGILYFFLHSR